MAIGRPAERTETTRLWRVRRRHDAIDAVLVGRDSGSVLRFQWNGRALVTLPFPSEAAARAAADERRQELIRAGWITHW